MPRICTKFPGMANGRMVEFRAGTALLPAAQCHRLSKLDDGRGASASASVGLPRELARFVLLEMRNSGSGKPHGASVQSRVDAQGIKLQQKSRNIEGLPKDSGPRVAREDLLKPTFVVACG